MNVFSTVKLDSLKSWNIPSAQDEEGESSSNEDPGCALKFTVVSAINQKIYLCQGGIANLELDCVVLPINEMRLKTSALAKEIHQAAGFSLEKYYKTLKDIKTGNAVLGSGYDLPARYIIQVMEPGNNTKFKSAVQNALHRSYRNAMQMAFDNNFKTIGFIPLYQSSASTLDEEAIHISLSTLRCCLNKLGHRFQAVILSVDEKELDLYLKLLPAYFPRSVQEASLNADLVAPHEVGEWGERVDMARAIRISDEPLSEPPTNESSSDDPGMRDIQAASSLSRDSVTKHSFSSMSDDHEIARKVLLKSMNDDSKRSAQGRVYQRLLRLARTEDVSDIAEAKALYICGRDKGGSPVAVLVAKHMDMSIMNLDKALLYFIRVLDPMANEPYNLVYFHTTSQSNNHPPMNFVKRVHNALDLKYKKNLKRLLIVHPTFASRLLVWFFTSFSARDISGQVTSVKSIPELYKYIAPDQIDIPPFVSDYDLKVNQEVYQRRTHQAHSLGKSNENLAGDVPDDPLL